MGTLSSDHVRKRFSSRKGQSRVKSYTPSNDSVRVPFEASGISWHNATASSVYRRMKRYESLTDSRPMQIRGGSELHRKFVRKEIREREREEREERSLDSLLLLQNWLLISFTLSLRYRDKYQLLSYKSKNYNVSLHRSMTDLKSVDRMFMLKFSTFMFVCQRMYEIKIRNSRNWIPICVARSTRSRQTLINWSSSRQNLSVKYKLNVSDK